jgi:hypothetical protein
MQHRCLISESFCFVALVLTNHPFGFNVAADAVGLCGAIGVPARFIVIYVGEKHFW